MDWAFLERLRYMYGVRSGWAAPRASFGRYTVALVGGLRGWMGEQVGERMGEGLWFLGSRDMGRPEGKKPCEPRGILR